jgi:hypothetical protein
MSIAPHVALDNAMQALWTARGYTSTPLVYGYREAMRTRDLDAVVLGHGRIVYHWGAWPGPEASAGAIEKPHYHAHRSGRDYASAPDLFTVHCHGYDPSFPDYSAAGAEIANDAAAWLLREKFFGILQNVVRRNNWLLEYGSPLLVRDPMERRLGEVCRVEFTIRFSLREAPEVPIEYPTPEPQGAVVGQSGDETTVVEVLP